MAWIEQAHKLAGLGTKPEPQHPVSFEHPEQAIFPTFDGNVYHIETFIVCCFISICWEVSGVPPGGTTASFYQYIAELGHCKGEDKGKEIRAFESQPEVIPFCL